MNSLFAETPLISGVDKETPLYEYMTMSRLVLHTTLLTVLFSIILKLAPRFIKTIIGVKAFDSLDKKSKDTFSVYAVSVPHHLVVTPISLWALWRMWKTPPGVPLDVDFPLLSLLPPVTLAYLIADTVFYVLPNMDFVFILHHFITGLLTCLLIASPAHSAARWSAALYVMELSSLPLALSYVYIKLKLTERPVYFLIQLALFLTFFTTRILHFTACVAALIFVHPAEFGWGVKILLAALALMQFYWFKKMLDTIVSMLRKSGKAS